MRWTIALIGCFLLVANMSLASEPPGERPASWAQPVKLEGVPNLHKVSDTLYRSAQPTAEGMKQLRKTGY